MTRRQPYSAGMHYTVIAEAAGIHLRDLYWDTSRIVAAYRHVLETFSPELRSALESQLRTPAVGSTGYGHLSALGVRIDFPVDGEPWPRPLIESPEDVPGMRDPPDFMSAGLMPQRRQIRDEIARLWGGDTRVGLGMSAEGPVTTAVLLAGEQFLTWPYEHPEAAHALLSFCTCSAVRFFKALWRTEEQPLTPKSWWIADDFAGLFPPRSFEEFVLPYWQRSYELIGCQDRLLHSELLRPAHLPMLAPLNLARFDPGADQYLTPEDLKEKCPVPYQLRILNWHMRDQSLSELQAMYRRLASFEPAVIQFGMEHVVDEAKFLGILAVARELNGEG